MIDEITNPVDCVEPGAVGVLILQDEMQVALSHSKIALFREYLGSACEHKGAVSCCVNDSAGIKRCVGTTAGLSRDREILDVVERVARNGRRDLFPFFPS